jgi:hypothetical protein
VEHKRNIKKTVQKPRKNNLKNKTWQQYQVIR